MTEEDARAAFETEQKVSAEKAAARLVPLMVADPSKPIGSA